VAHPTGRRLCCSLMMLCHGRHRMKGLTVSMLMVAESSVSSVAVTTPALQRPSRSISPVRLVADSDEEQAVSTVMAGPTLP
jgi:hypothetical protein